METTDEFSIDLILNTLAFSEKYVLFFTAYLEKMTTLKFQNSKQRTFRIAIIPIFSFSIWNGGNFNFILFLVKVVQREEFCL
ncbi:hypothetical protein C0966_07070 [Bacillus methanolicus]|nr:hypothetical protein [Bacillus methanolicus]